MQSTARGEREGRNCYFGGIDSLFWASPKWLSNRVPPFPFHLHHTSSLLSGDFAQIVAMQRLNCRGSSSLPGGFYALGWEKELLKQLPNAVNKQQRGMNQKADGCSTTFRSQKLSLLIALQFHLSQLWQSSLGLLMWKAKQFNDCK
jgi:hypothetical protein